MPGLTLGDLCDLSLVLLYEQVDAFVTISQHAHATWGEEGSEPPPDYEAARLRFREMLEAPLGRVRYATPEDQWTADLREALGLPV